MSVLISLATDLYKRVLEGFKYVAAFFLIRRATQIESDRAELKKTVKVKTDQLDIAARPDVELDTVLERMRKGDF